MIGGELGVLINIGSATSRRKWRVRKGLLLQWSPRAHGPVQSSFRQFFQHAEILDLFEVQRRICFAHNFVPSTVVIEAASHAT
jgi:hypothetical protein